MLSKCIVGIEQLLEPNAVQFFKNLWRTFRNSSKPRVETKFLRERGQLKLMFLIFMFFGMITILHWVLEHFSLIFVFWVYFFPNLLIKCRDYWLFLGFETWSWRTGQDCFYPKKSWNFLKKYFWRGILIRICWFGHWETWNFEEKLCKSCIFENYAIFWLFLFFKS